MSHPYYGLNELREMFLSYFESKGRSEERRVGKECYS